MLPAKLRPDCAACSGLCCVVPPFDASQGFGFDKPAHTPCANLQSDFRCRIHDELKACGFTGCTVFDCFGAGQWVTQHLFHGSSWRESPQVAEQMFDSFSRMLPLHELMALITTALTCDLGDEALRHSLDQKLREIEAICEGETANLGRIDIIGIKQQTMALLRSVDPSAAAASLRARTSK